MIIVKWIAPVMATSVFVRVTDPYFDLIVNGVFHKQRLLTLSPLHYESKQPVLSSQ